MAEESTTSPGKFVKVVESDKKASSNQQPNKRKFNENDKKSLPGPKNVKIMKFNNKPQGASNEQSENRLKAFGINPKKFKNKIKYGRKNDQQNKNVKTFPKKKMNS